MKVLPNPLLIKPVRPLRPWRPTPWKNLPHITNQRLPPDPTDIRGIDLAAYGYINRRNGPLKLPVLAQCAFFTLRFIPASHPICGARKSNVAYTFTNYGSPVLNSTALQKAFKAYKGKYRSLEFFSSVPAPMDTAAARIKNRKHIKRTLHLVLHEVVPDTPAGVQLVSGIFHFKYSCLAATEDDKRVLRDNLRQAVARLKDTSFRRSLESVCEAQSRDSLWAQLFRDVKPENTVGARQVPGYFPKLPFLPKLALTGSMRQGAGRSLESPQ